MIIDAHIHIFPDSIAEKALKNLSEICKMPYWTDGSVKGTEEKLKDWKIDKAICMNIATKPKQQDTINRWAASIQNDTLLCFGTVHPDAPDAIEELQKIRDLGLYGIKFHPDYQNFRIDDPRMFPIYEAVSGLGFPVTFHTGWDPLSPDLIHAPSQAVAKVADLFPKLTIIAAHMGGMNRYNESETYLCGKKKCIF